MFNVTFYYSIISDGLLGVTISGDLTCNEHVENIVANAGKRVYMLYQLKRAEIGQHDLVTIYVSVIRPVLEYACPVWHTNLNKHLTESIETVQKRALKCIYPGNEYADILCLPNLPCLKKRRDSLCTKYFQNINIDTNMFFKLKTSKITRWHDFTLGKRHSSLDFRKYYFTQMTVNELNNLSADCVDSSSINMFKNRIDHYVVGQDRLRFVHVDSR